MDQVSGELVLIEREIKSLRDLLNSKPIGPSYWVVMKALARMEEALWRLNAYHVMKDRETVVA